MTKYRLSEAAANDFEQLFEYGKYSIYYIITDSNIDVMRILRAENTSTAFK